MSQIKYKFVGSQNRNTYGKTTYVKIPEELKTIEDIENYIIEDMNKIKSGGFNVVRISYYKKDTFKFDHERRAFKYRIFP
jgi:hypothetical protein